MLERWRERVRFGMARKEMGGYIDSTDMAGTALHLLEVGQIMDVCMRV